MIRGFFITFEGADGAGKTTQLNLLAKHLEKCGFSVIITREPGGTAIGRQIREVLLDPANTALSAAAEALLYMADRAQHVTEVILPALKAGKIVLSDRYADSTFIYQGAARSLTIKTLAPINAFAAGNLLPDLTILLDGGAEDLMKRLRLRGERDRIEKEDIVFHEKVRQGFRELAQTEPARIRLVNANRDINSIHQEIAMITEVFLKKRDDDENK